MDDERRRFEENDQEVDELRVLILEDVATDAELAVAQLKRSGLRVAAMCVDTEQAFVQALGDFEPDLILSDFSLPSNFDGLTALEIARNWSAQVPFVFLSGTIGEERAVEAMRRGATDYVLKDRLDRLVPVVTRAMQEAGERSARRKAEEELAATKGRLDSILSSLVDVVWSLSLKPYQLLYVNAAAETIYQRGLSGTHPDPRLWFELVHGEDRERVSQHWNQALQGNAFDIEYRIVHNDGGWRWIHDRAQPVHDDSGAMIRLDGLARDVTPRKLQEARIARLSRIREVLSGINAAIVRTTDKHALFREACRIAVEDGKFRAAWVGLVVLGQAEVEPVAFIGHDGTSLEELDASMVVSLAETGATCRALSQGGRVIFNDIPADAPPSIQAQALAHGYRSLVALALVVDDEAIGTVTLCAAEADFFDQEELRLLSELAADISFAYAYRTKEEQLNYLAYYDVLTGLSNRSFLHVQLAGAVVSGQRHNHGLTALVINLDNLKTINDGLGHTAGDALLKIAGARIKDCVREDDIIARYGGDEFVVVLSHQGLAEDASHTIQRLLGAIAQPIRIDDRDFYVTCSVGASIFPQDGADADTLLRNAFAAMHRAKELGGNGAQFFEAEINARVTERLGLDALLRRALERSEFTLNFQPKVSLLDGELTGVEALLRWSHPDLGPVSPVTFIPILESNGLIGEVGEWVLREACAQIGAWEKSAVRPVPIAVNLSGKQLQQPGLDLTVKRILDESGVQPGMLELEITESVLMRNPEQVIGTLRNLQSMGIRLSVDDFGTGYSSLSYLRSFPLDSLKIDRSFISDVTTNPDDALITRAVISMAHNLRLKVVAEGVETAAQLAFLAVSGCDEIQGYYFARPMDAEACTRFLKERRHLNVTSLIARGDSPTLLLVDDENNVLSALKRVFRKDGYRILTANHATEAFELLAANSVGVVVSDQRMPGITGVEFLSRVKDLYPDTIRIVLSGYTDLETVTDAINRGAVYKFLSKPWDDKELRRHIQDAFALRTFPSDSMQSGLPARSPALP